MLKRFAVITMVFFSLTGLASAQSTLRVGGNDAPPYRILSSGVPSGLYIDIFNAVAKEAGFNVEYSEMPMARALSSMENGSIDVMLGPNLTADREKFMFFLVEVPFPREDKGIYLKRGTPDIASNKKQITNYESGLKMVDADRLDAVIIPTNQANYLLTPMSLSIYKATLSFQGKASYVAVSKASSQAMIAAPMLVNALKKLKANGTIEKIISKY
jgi:polar amino acid transport system substrate-binding protein